MAITAISALASTAVVAAGASTAIVATGPVAIHADGLLANEFIYIWRLGPSGSYILLRNENGPIVLSLNPNTVYLDVANTYRLSKTATASVPAVGYEDQ
jgi:hypothetical protein